MLLVYVGNDSLTAVMLSRDMRRDTACSLTVLVSKSRIKQNKAVLAEDTALIQLKLHYISDFLHGREGSAN